MTPPVDPRLWRHARSARRYLALSVALSLITTGCIVVTALPVARVLAGVITDPERRALGDWAAELVVLTVAIGTRTVASWWQSRLAHRAGAQVVAELENAVLAAGAVVAPRDLETQRAELVVVVSSGLSGLRAYLAGYLPALLLAALVPPVVLGVIAVHDPVSGVIILVTLPLIPVFMVLIGLLTRGQAAGTLAAAARLSGQLLDLFTGMPTLRALGREGGGSHGDADHRGSERDSSRRTMVHRVRELGETLHQRTMSALRIAFLSSLVLEMLATLCVALVAVSIGMRLVFGEMGLFAGLVALILAPEVYWPLRTVGERFHAAQDGMAAAERAFAVLEPVDTTGVGAQPGHRGVRIGELHGTIEIRDLTVRARDGSAPEALSAVLRPGAVTVLTGPNGSGKSTVLQVVLGLVAPDRGMVTVDGIDVRELDSQHWWMHIAWLPQQPVLVPGTLRENLELLDARAVTDSRRAATRTLDELEMACAATGFDAVLDELPDRWDTVVGASGIGLSLGQRQRLALTRVLAAERPILLLDEPTAHLDDASAEAVLTAVTARARAGATVVIVGHRPSTLAIADHIVRVRAASVDPADRPGTVGRWAVAHGLEFSDRSVEGIPGVRQPGDELVVSPPCIGGVRGSAADPIERKSLRRTGGSGLHTAGMVFAEFRRMRMLLQVSRWRITVAVGWGASALGSGLGLAVLAAWLIARAWQMPPVLDLGVAVVAVRALGISRGLCRYLERLATHDVALHAMTTARTTVYRTLAAADIWLPRRRSSAEDATDPTRMRRGDLLTRIGSDIDDLGAVVVRAFVPITVAVGLSAAAVVLVATISAAAAAVLAVALVVSGMIAPWLSARAAREAESAVRADRSEFTAAALTVLDHATELRVADRLDDALATAIAANRRAVAAEDRAASRGAWAAAATPLSVGVSVLGALLIGIVLYDSGSGAPVAALQPAAAGGITPMALAVLVLLPLSVFEAVGPLPAAARALTGGRAALCRLSQRESGPAESRPVFGFPELPSGKRIAVIGPSGAGKTTLLMAWAGLFDTPRSGVTFFAEDAHLFGTTVLENLRVSRGDVTVPEAESALRAVGAGDWIAALPDGVHTDLVGGASAISGGQRRRVLLARALVSPARVLLLDEPTEHLEVEAGAELLRRLLDSSSGLVAPDRTVVVVTHQLPPDHKADTVVRCLGQRRSRHLTPSSINGAEQDAQPM